MFSSVHCLAGLPLAWTLGSAMGCVPAFAQAPSEPPAPTAELPVVEVVGRRQSGGYQADDVSGTKTSLPLRERPQSVRVISPSSESTGSTPTTKPATSALIRADGVNDPHTRPSHHRTTPGPTRSP